MKILHKLALMAFWSFLKIMPDLTRNQDFICYQIVVILSLLNYLSTLAVEIVLHVRNLSRSFFSDSYFDTDNQYNFE